LTNGTNVGLAVTAFRLGAETVRFLRPPTADKAPLVTVVLHQSHGCAPSMSVPMPFTTPSGTAISASPMVNNESGRPTTYGTHWRDDV
jgi:hypothetical protein